MILCFTKKSNEGTRRCTYPSQVELAGVGQCRKVIRVFLHPASHAAKIACDVVLVVVALENVFAVVCSGSLGRAEGIGLY